MNVDTEAEFKEIERLIGGVEQYGPHGFLEEGDGIAHRFVLDSGLDDLPESSGKHVNTLVYVISGRTALLPLDGIFPECKVLTGFTEIPRLVCIADPQKCSVGNNCLGTILTRLGGLAQVHDSWKLFVLYWKYKRHLMGLVIRAADSNMRMVTINPHALDYFVSRSEKFQVQM